MRRGSQDLLLCLPLLSQAILAAPAPIVSYSTGASTQTIVTTHTITATMTNTLSTASSASPVSSSKVTTSSKSSTSSTSTTKSTTASSSSVQAKTAVATPSCECYGSSGSSGTTFSNHNFFDFRNINNPQGLYNSEPALVATSQSQGKESSQSGYLSSSAFTNFWGIQNWGNPSSSDAPNAKQNSPQNVYIRKLNHFDKPTCSNMSQKPNLIRQKMQQLT
jgi:hypothetical protein